MITSYCKSGRCFGLVYQPAEKFKMKTKTKPTPLVALKIIEFRRWCKEHSYLFDGPNHTYCTIGSHRIEERNKKALKICKRTEKVLIIIDFR